MKKWLLGLGSLGAIVAPIATVVACDDDDDYDKLTGTVKFTDSKDTWHGLFWDNELPNDGTILQVDVRGGTTLEATWTSALDADVTPTAWTESKASQADMVAYLAQLFAQANAQTVPGLTAEEVYGEMKGLISAHSLPTTMPTTEVPTPQAPAAQATEFEVTFGGVDNKEATMEVTAYQDQVTLTEIIGFLRGNGVDWGTLGFTFNDMTKLTFTMDGDSETVDLPAAQGQQDGVLMGFFAAQSAPGATFEGKIEIGQSPQGSGSAFSQGTIAITNDILVISVSDTSRAVQPAEVFSTASPMPGFDAITGIKVVIGTDETEFALASGVPADADALKTELATGLASSSTLVNCFELQ